MKMKISPSLMCMDLKKLSEQIEFLNERADFYHVDIMDGHYVKNITLSPFFVESIQDIVKLPMDVHLMVENPNDFIVALVEAGAEYVSPQVDTITKDAFRTINTIKDLGAKVGVVLNPADPLESISQYAHLLDKITIMTVDPGFAGQKFIPEMLDKIRTAKRIREEKGYHYLIEIDGSCNERTFMQLKEAGADVLIVGSSGLFSLSDDLTVAWDQMLQNLEV